MFLMPGRFNIGVTLSHWPAYSRCKFIPPTAIAVFRNKINANLTRTATAHTQSWASPALVVRGRRASVKYHCQMGRVSRFPKILFSYMGFAFGQLTFRQVRLIQEKQTGPCALLLS